MNLKNVLITLSIVAGIIALITFYVVFYSGGGTYVVSSTMGPDAEIFSTSTPQPASSTASSTISSSTLAFASSSDSSMPSSSSSGGTSIASAPITWTQGNEAMSITGAAIAGSNLTLNVQVGMGSVAECVPLTLRLIADEQGDLSPPVTPQFTFPDTGNCNGTPGETYSAQPIVFTLTNPDAFPIILTTGGTANVLFEVVQNSDGSLTVQLPPSSD